MDFDQDIANPEEEELEPYDFVDDEARVDLLIAAGVMRAGVWLEKEEPENGWSVREISEGIERARLFFANNVKTYIDGSQCSLTLIDGSHTNVPVKITLWNNGTVEASFDRSTAM